MISFLLLLICPHPPEEMPAQKLNQLGVVQSTLDMGNDIKNILIEEFNIVLPFFLKSSFKKC